MHEDTRVGPQHGLWGATGSDHHGPQLGGRGELPEADSSLKPDLKAPKGRRPHPRGEHPDGSGGAVCEPTRAPRSLVAQRASRWAPQRSSRRGGWRPDPAPGHGVSSPRLSFLRGRRKGPSSFPCTPVPPDTGTRLHARGWQRPALPGRQGAQPQSPGHGEKAFRQWPDRTRPHRPTGPAPPLRPTQQVRPPDCHSRSSRACRFCQFPRLGPAKTDTRQSPRPGSPQTEDTERRERELVRLRTDFPQTRRALHTPHQELAPWAEPQRVPR